MKKLIVSLLPVVALFFASSLAGRAGTEMAPPPSSNSQADAGYWVPAPNQPPPPQAGYYYPPAPYYAGPPPYYYGSPPYYGRGYGYYGPGPGVRIYAPGLFFGFGFHHHR